LRKFTTTQELHPKLERKFNHALNNFKWN
jgi:hypothetical protein